MADTAEDCDRSAKRQATDARTVEVGEEAFDRSSWYSDAVDYWAGVDATIDGVLGGFGHLTDIELRDSHAFVKKTLGAALLEGAPRPGTLACDCGAGIGRVSKGLLLAYCEKVDIVENCKKYTDAAQKFVGEEHINKTYVLGMQEFKPAPCTYDIVWVQWAIGHLADADFIAFFARAVAALKPGGYLGLKENNCKEEQITEVDEEDSSVTRSDSEFRRLFKLCHLEVTHFADQADFPPDMFGVRMYCLKPK